jgi:hypothetical protein
MPKVLTEDDVRVRIRRIQIVYLILLVLALLGSIGLVLSLTSGVSAQNGFETLLTLCLTGLIYFGLRFRRAWVVHLVLICSTFGLVMTLFTLSRQAGDIVALVGKLFSCFIGLFCTYQMSLFSRKDVRTFFQDKGSTIFG